MQLSRAVAILCAILAALIPAAAPARITGIAIDRVESPTFDGRSFGSVGQYVKLVGRATGEIDPDHPLTAALSTSSARRVTPADFLRHDHIIDKRN